MIDPALFQENERTAPSNNQRRVAKVGNLICEVGAELKDIEIAYESWGALNGDKTNAILICHALSGDSHAIGWWDRMIGPGKPFDTEKYFVKAQQVRPHWLWMASHTVPDFRWSQSVIWLRFKVGSLSSLESPNCFVSQEAPWEECRPLNGQQGFLVELEKPL
jgi:hypothetical protein